MARHTGWTFIVAALIGLVGTAAGPTAPQGLTGDLRMALASARLVHLSAATRDELQALYGAAPEPLWLSADGRLTGSGQLALAILESAAEHGLNPADYRPAADGPAHTAQFEINVSLGLLRYLRDLRQGRVDGRALGYQLSARSDAVNLAAIIREAHSDGRLEGMVERVAPPMRQYRALRAALATYRALAADRARLLMPAFPTVVKPGDTFSGAASLTDLLQALGDMPPGVAPAADNVYTPEVIAGVTRFQARHNLQTDGTIGRETQEALRVPLGARVRQIELTLERLRWLPRDPPGAALVVNIPMFRLWSWEAVPNRVVPPLTMKVIVGRARVTPTPVFAASLETVIFRPYWNIPASILVNETLPAVRRDPAYLERHQMEIVRGDTDRPEVVPLTADALRLLAQGTLRVRQRPGPSNALGLIKFLFPNPMNVYMHDTPTPELFVRQRRDLSHGCVRVEDPIALAEWVLNSPEWSRDAIVKATTATDSRSVRVPEPVRVILLYATAAVMPDGTVHFATDVYGRDGPLSRALGEKSAVASRASIDIAHR